MPNLPSGFVLDKPTLPQGFVLDDATQPAPKKETPSFISSVGKKIMSRERKVQESKRKVRAGERTRIGAGFYQGAQPILGALDIGGEVVSRGYKALGEPLKREAQAVGRAVGGLPTIGGGTLATTVPQELGVLQQKFPRAAEVAEATLGYAGLTPSGVLGKATKAAGEVIEDVGKTVSTKGIKQVAKKKMDFSQGLVMPRETAKVMEAAERGGRVSETKLLNKIIEPTKDEIATAKIVSDLDIKKHRSFSFNNKKVLEGIDSKAKSLAADLDKSGILFPRNEVKARLQKNIDSLVDENPFLVGNSKLTAERVRAIAFKVIDENAGTPAGLLKARKELDRILRSQTKTSSGKDIFDTPADKAINTAISDIRQTINNFIAEKAPTITVKKSLREQELLYRATDNISAKAAREGKNVISQMVNKLPLNNQLTRDLAAVGLVAGGTTVASIAPAAVLGAVAVTAGVKVITGAATKKALGGLSQAIGKAIKAEKSVKAVKQLRIDRLVIIDMINAIEDEE